MLYSGNVAHLHCSGSVPHSTVPSHLSQQQMLRSILKEILQFVLLNNLPPAHEPQHNELQQIKNCNPCANGHGIFVLLHYGDLMQTERLSNHFL